MKGKSEKKRYKILRKRMIIFGVAVFLIALRMALEPIVLHYVNKTLSQTEGYSGSVQDVDIKLWRGAYQIERAEIFKTESDLPVPLFDGDLIEFSIYWKALWKGQVVSKAIFNGCKINFIDGAQTGEDRPWGEMLAELAPFNIERLDLNDCGVHFWNFQGEENVNVYVNPINGYLANLNNSESLSDSRFATGEFNGTAMESGDAFLGIKMNPSAETTTMDVNVKVTGVDVTELDPFLRQYSSIDLEEGTFDLVVEAAIENGQIDGYLKPIFNDLVIYSPKQDGGEDKDGPLKQIGEAVVSLVSKPVTNLPEDKLATKIPLSGPVDNPDNGGFIIFTNLLRNAFVQSFTSELDNNISLGGPDTAPTEGGEAEGESKKDKPGLGRKILNIFDGKNDSEGE